jgi:polysaccharide deacetylase 2 family uncharacterized protein YibQ
MGQRPRSKSKDSQGPARIASKPVRVGRRRLVWALALGGGLAVVFGLGLTVGGLLRAVGVGQDDRGQEVAVAVPPSSPDGEGDAGDAPRYQLPVAVRSSDKARRDYLSAYEEDLKTAPPSPRLAPPPVQSFELAPEPAPKPAPEPNIAALPEAEGVPETTRQPTPPSPETPTDFPVAPLTRIDPEVPARPTWLANAQPATLSPDQPILAIVIDDVGVDVAHSRQAVRLPAPLTLAFLPYGFDLQTMVKTARGNGHEIMVHLPLEPQSATADPGPNALLNALSAEEIGRRIDWNLARFDGYVGLNNHMGSKFSTNTDGMRQLLQAVKDRGLFFLDSVTIAQTKGYRLAAEMGVPYAVRDVFIDHTLDKATIRRQLAEALASAKTQGFAVAIGHPHDETLEVLRAWLPTVAGEGVQLVPLSAVIRRRYGRG